MKVWGQMFLILFTVSNIYAGSIKSCLTIPTARDEIRVNGTIEIKDREIVFVAEKEIFQLFNIENGEKKRRIRIKFDDIGYIIINNKRREIYVCPDKESRFFNRYRNIHSLVYSYVILYTFEWDFALCIETDVKRFQRAVKKYTRTINRGKIFLK
jgi:hypothetical protein